MKETIDPGHLLASRPAAASAEGEGSRRARPLVVVASDSLPLVEEIRSLVGDVLGALELDRLPQEGPVVLDRLRAQRPRLAFVSIELRLMEGLTLLRALPPGRARQVVLLAPDTLEGYRLAWDGLYFGARDFVVTRGVPPHRLKGSAAIRRRQIAHLLAEEPPAQRAFDSGFEGAWSAVPVVDRGIDLRDNASPWVVLAETRHLAALIGWLRRLPPEAPVLLRVPEGPRFLRVAREGLERLLLNPVRIGADGDRLVPGHVHLVSDADPFSVVERSGFPCLRLHPPTASPGGWAPPPPALELLSTSPCRLRILRPEPAPGELDERSAALATSHALFRLRAARPADDAVLSPLDGEAPRRAA